MNGATFSVFVAAVLLPFLVIVQLDFVTAQADEFPVTPPLTTTATSGGPPVTKNMSSPGGNRDETSTNDTDSAGLFLLCHDDSDCSWPAMSVCRDDGTNEGTTRCQCAPGYQQYNARNGAEQEELLCGEMVTSVDVEECRECRDNEGMCHRRSSDDNQLHVNDSVMCECPVSRTGDHCETVRVNVSCGGSSLEMKICFDPHPNVNFSGDWVMSTVGHSDDPECVGSMVVVNSSETQWCDAGMQALTLNMVADETNNLACGTTLSNDARMQTYSNQVVVKKRAVESDVTNPLKFIVFCTYKRFDHRTFEGNRVYWLNGNKRGEIVNPSITLSILDRFNEEIEAGVSVRVNDPLRFRIALDTSGTYESLSVKYCTASSSPVIPDHYAETLPITSNGCPVTPRSTSSWYWTQDTSVSSDLFVAQTGFVPAFQLYSSNVVYLHCNLHLCLIGDVSCQLKTEEDCSDVSHVNGRRKRSAQDVVLRRSRRAATSGGTYTVTSRFEVHDESPNDPQAHGAAMSSGVATALIAILVVVVILVVIATTAAAAFHFKRRRQMRAAAANQPEMLAMPPLEQTYTRF